MKLRSIALFSFLLFVSAIASHAQAVPTKIAFIDTGAFTDEKAGITKYVNAYKSLAAEFKKATDDLNALNARLAAVAKEVEALQQKIQSPPPGTDINALRASLEQKIDEGQRLQIELKRKQEDIKAQYEKKEAAVAGPIMQEIGIAIEAYRKTKGYDLILDAVKLSEAILGYDKSLDITAAFIADFNSKSNGVPAK